ncbi:hypothetical protein [Methylobacterium sp. OAE515]|uniref:hypothetical protein n=1 Tax=Methylobacterium sp. OAE515 TaxID=2817895 RepID=UPI00178B8D78
MLTTDHLLRVIDAFREAREVSDARVSALLFNDGKRVRILRCGGDVGSRPLAASFQWLSDHWPAGGKWPSDVPRPPVSPIETVASAQPEALAS